MNRRLVILVAVMAMCLQAAGTTARWGKLSPRLRRMAMAADNGTRRMAGAREQREMRVCAFVKVAEAADAALLEQCDGHILAQWGDLLIADIPVKRLAALSLDSRILRIEASESNSVTLDTVPAICRIDSVWAGINLPQAYTGKGVVMGIEDVGFDLTHPTFYDTEGNNYRVKCLWDMLTPDTVGSTLPVGRDYTTAESVLAHARSHDGLIQTHGTHTAGTAAGSGYGTAYRGVAYESDLCLVSNYVSNDSAVVDSATRSRYTSATDALGFKYIFDYAQQQGKPCVISFSEGRHQRFSGEDQLFYAALDSMVGPGRIFVTSAGNEGHVFTYVRKEPTVEADGAFLYDYYESVTHQMRADGEMVLRFTYYGTTSEVREYATEAIRAAGEGGLSDTITVDGTEHVFNVCGFDNAYAEGSYGYEFTIDGPFHIGGAIPISVEMVGAGVTAELFRINGTFLANDKNSAIGHHLYKSHSVYFPGSAPSAICVGASAWRDTYVCEAGTTVTTDWGSGGTISSTSSVGPTFGGLTKPDVVAPGVNVMASLSHFYRDNNPQDTYFPTLVVTSTSFGDATYPWGAYSGTSMSSPIVGGIVALWLQADPELTPDEVKAVMQRTSQRHDASLEYPNNTYGCGEIDAYRGLLDILGLTGIEGVYDHRPLALSMSFGGDNVLRLSAASGVGGSLSVNVYSVAGVCVMSTRCTANEACEIDLSALPAGVYAVAVAGATEHTTGSWLVRVQ